MTSSTPTIDPQAVCQKDIQTLFTNITPRYDLLNTLLSFRIDHYWRSVAVRIGLEISPKRIIDIGTGTGKLLSAFQAKQSFDYCAGVDLCESMLQKAGETVRAQRTIFACADALTLPLQEGTFDLAVSAFTMRSLPDLGKFFTELARILIPGGRMVMLELTRPEVWWLRAAYYPYLNFYLPFLGWLISGDRNAYRFLADSIMSFKDRPAILALIESNGFRNARAVNLTGGLATLFVADRK